MEEDFYRKGSLIAGVFLILLYIVVSIELLLKGEVLLGSSLLTSYSILLYSIFKVFKSDKGEKDK